MYGYVTWIHLGALFRSPIRLCDLDSGLCDLDSVRVMFVQVYCLKVPHRAKKLEVVHRGIFAGALTHENCEPIKGHRRHKIHSEPT